MIINVARDFSEFPAGRFKSEGPANGEKFREDFLIPALTSAIKKNSKLVIALDGTEGYGSSFLEEAFGGLTRKNYSVDTLLNTIILETKDQELRNEIVEYIKEGND